MSDSTSIKIEKNIYLDACSLIDLAQHEAGYPIPDEKRLHLENCKAFLNAAMLGECTIYGSLLLIAECTKVRTQENGNKIYDENIKNIFNRLLLAGRPIIPVQPTPQIVHLARDLTWINEIPKLGSMDSIHLATAISMKCDAFITSDKALIKQDKLLTQKYGLRVCTADKLSPWIPDPLKQNSLFQSLE